ncbi:YraN family protein [Roseovarius sp. Pro17]|uniref:YraN family protein n=1 Tax=Roseovarius sp. Pro17 TaxID=3108175 RepID=UPI002D766627|nr:YraN family protein [Roseovarius sp. Pro17]
MPQLLDLSDLAHVPAPARRDRGKRAYNSGLAAEDRAVALYIAAGLRLLETRWRGKSGEIDLILADGEEIVFVEVKQARTHDAAIASLRPAQMRRIHLAGSEYLGHCPKGQLTDVRFDLAVVDGAGRCDIMQGAFSHF